MYRIVALVGKSGVGKSSVEEMLWKLDYNHIISYTSRRPRYNEINTVDYNFVYKERFLEMIEEGEVLEYTERYGNYYGIGKHCIDLNKNNYVCTVDPKGYDSLKAHFGDAVIGIYLYIEDHERFIRLLNRDKDVQKASSRFYSDNDVFDKAEKSVLYKIPNIDTKTTALTISELIIKSINVKENY